MKQILKYQFEQGQGIRSIVMPKGAVILTVGHQGDQPVVWVIADASQELVDRRLFSAYTGKEPPDGLYVGTVMLMGNTFIMHMFDLGEV